MGRRNKVRSSVRSSVALLPSWFLVALRVWTRRSLIIPSSVTLNVLNGGWLPSALLEREDARPIVLHADHEPAVSFLASSYRDCGNVPIFVSGTPARVHTHIAAIPWVRSNPLAAILHYGISVFFFLRIRVRVRTFNRPSAPPDLSHGQAFQEPAFPRSVGAGPRSGAAPRRAGAPLDLAESRPRRSRREIFRLASP
jgi:hypothetical protein